MRESYVESYLYGEIKGLGGFAYKFSSPNRRNVPDRLVLLPFRFCFFVECKATGKKATPAQLREHERLRRLGFPVYVVDSKPAVDAMLVEIVGLWAVWKRRIKRWLKL